MRIPAMLLLLLASAGGQAQNPYLDLGAPELRTRIAAIDGIHQESWYRVEVLVFARTRLTTQEYWRLGRTPGLAPENTIRPDRQSVQLPEHADEGARRAAALGAWQYQAGDQHVLGDMMGRMADSGKFRVLFHESWVQPVRNHNQAFPLYLHGGEPVPVVAPPAVATETGPEPGLPPLEPLDAVPGVEQAPLEAPFGEQSFVAPATQPEFQGTLRLHLSRYLHVEPSLWYTSTAADGTRFWVSIDQARRMRSEELHYLDHPLFGMLIRLTPYQTAAQEELELLTEALKAKQKR